MTRPSFGSELLRGRLRVDLLDPLPDAGLDADAEAFLARLRAFCTDKVDGRLIEREDRIPDEVVDGLRDLGAFAIKLPREYGGLGLSGVCYHRALMIVSTAHSSLGELLGAHQAIGLIQPLRLFGTDAQKRELLPRCVREISAFALTEPDIGNDPFRMRTTATPTDDGGYRLDGVKLWTTNGTIAHLIVVMALVPALGERPGRHVRVRGGGRRAGGHGGAPQLLPGAARPGERGRPAAPGRGAREPPDRAGGAGAPGGARRAGHRPAVDARRLRRRRQVEPEDRPRVVRRTRAVGPADRRARGGGGQDRLHRGDRLRAGGHGRGVRPARRRRRCWTRTPRPSSRSCSRRSRRGGSSTS